MAQPIERAKAKLSDWLERHRHLVLCDEQSATLLDVASGKTTGLPWRDVRAYEEKVHPETGDAYFVLLFENGNQVALVDPGGVAFPPSEVNTGVVRNLPPVVCLRDFHTLKQRADH